MRNRPFILPTQLLLASLFAVIGVAHAEPWFTNAARIKATARIVVIGTFLGKNADGLHRIGVERALRGTVGTAVLRVGHPAGGTPKLILNERAVFFIDSQNQLLLVARPLRGDSLETGVLKLVGFCDYNAHIVTPRVVTLASLRDFLSSGKLTHRVKAHLVFFDRRTRAPVRSKTRSLEFTVEEGRYGRGVLKRFSSSHGSLPRPSAAAVGHRRDVSLTFAKLGVRLVGRALGLDATGAIVAELWPHNGVPLFEDRWEKFITGHGSLRTRVRVDRGGASWELVLGSRSLEEIGELHRPGEDPAQIETLHMSGSQGYRTQFGKTPFPSSKLETRDRRFTIAVAKDKRIHIVITGGKNRAQKPVLPFVELSGVFLHQLVTEGPLSCRVEIETKGRVRRQAGPCNLELP